LHHQGHHQDAPGDGDKDAYTRAAGEQDAADDQHRRAHGDVHGVGLQVVLHRNSHRSASIRTLDRLPPGGIRGEDEIRIRANY